MISPLPSPGAADALLFDLGRVVLDIDFGKVVACWAGHAGCEPAHLAGRFSWRDEFYQRHEKGEISDGEFFAALRALLGVDLSDAQFLDGWNKIFTGEMPGIAKLLRAPRNACRFMPSPIPTTPTSNIFRNNMPMCSAISAKYFCRPQSGFGNRMLRPLITW